MKLIRERVFLVEGKHSRGWFAYNLCAKTEPKAIELAAELYGYPAEDIQFIKVETVCWLTGIDDDLR